MKLVTGVFLMLAGFMGMVGLLALASYTHGLERQVQELKIDAEQHKETTWNFVEALKQAEADATMWKNNYRALSEACYPNVVANEDKGNPLPQFGDGLRVHE